MANNLLLINDRSGAVSAIGAKRCVQALSEVITGSLDVEIASGDPTELVKIVRAAIASKPVDHIHLAAGDGTCAAIAGVLTDCDVTLTPLPGGTMNAFSRDLGFDADLLAAIAQIPDTKARNVDIAYANEFPFLNNVVFGAYTSVAESREHLRNAKGVGEILDSITEIAGTIVHAGTERYKVVVDGIREHILTNTLMVANNLYDGADMLRPTRARLNEGRLGCYLAKSKTSIDFLTVLLEAVTGKLTDSELIAAHSCVSCRIESSSGILEISIDGEANELSSPVDIRIKPKALRILAPAPG